MAKATRTLTPTTRTQRPRLLAPFSFLVMSTIERLQPEHRYGAEIDRILNEKFGELTDVTATYVTLLRLVGKGYLKGKDVLAPTGFKHVVTTYTLTPDGKAALQLASDYYKMLAAYSPY